VAEPVTGLVENFSPMPRVAPPPRGKLMAGGAIRKEPLSAPRSDGRGFSGVRASPVGLGGTPGEDRAALFFPMARDRAYHS
jgi:hypothetical protein